MSNPVSFGGWLRQRRKESGITQDDLAETIGCALTTLAKMESGERRPSRQIALLLADYFKIAPDERAAFIIFARAGPGVAGAMPEADATTPWRNARAHLTNLPVVLTHLLGREQDSARLRDLLTGSSVRLLSITGPPGVGKTSLAICQTAQLLDQFADGVFFVDLAPIDDPDLVVAAIATVLEVRQGAEALLAALERHLENKRLLLVLDNFEQLLDAAPIVVELLQASPWLKVLVTSREALYVRGERVFTLAPLALPEPGWVGGGPSSSPAVGLFVERAQNVVPDFALGPQNAGDVAAICVMLDGLPLAIELAAANSILLSPAEMRSALDGRLRLSSRGSRDLPLRQHTLRRAISWSYDLLSPVERTLFAVIGVFVGGCTLGAIAAVLTPAPTPPEISIAGPNTALPPEQASQLVIALLKKNLLRREVTAGQESRLTMLETIREYAAERLLESGQEEVVRLRHAQYYLKLAEQASAEWVSTNQAAWSTRLEAERRNCRAALEWLLSAAAAKEIAANDNGDRLQMLLRMINALYKYWWLRGHISEARHWLELALEASDAAAGDTVMAGTLPDRLGLDMLRGQAIVGLGWIAHEESDYVGARSLSEQGLALMRSIGDELGVSDALNNMASAAMYLGDYSRATALYEESLSLRRKFDEPRGIAQSLGNLGSLAILREDYGAARQLLNEVLLIYRGWNDKNHIATVAGNLALAMIMQRDYAAADLLLNECMQLAEELGDRSNAAYALCNLGFSASEQGDHQAGLRYHKESLALSIEVSDKRLSAECLEGVARALLGLQNPLAAIELFAAAELLRQDIGAPEANIDTSRNNAVREAAQLCVGESQWQAAWNRGYKLTLDRVLPHIPDFGSIDNVSRLPREAPH